jgi:ECF sigma factor
MKLTDHIHELQLSDSDETLSILMTAYQTKLKEFLRSSEKRKYLNAKISLTEIVIDAFSEIRVTIRTNTASGKYGSLSSRDFFGLLVTIATRKRNDSAKYHTSKKRDARREFIVDLENVESVSLTTPMTQAIGTEMASTVWPLLIDEPTEVLRIANIFHFGMGLNAAEIAELLAKSNGGKPVKTERTLKRHFERAKKRIKGTLSDRYGEAYFERS